MSRRGFTYAFHETNWEETARFYCRNEQYYHGLLVEIGYMDRRREWGSKYESLYVCND